MKLYLRLVGLWRRWRDSRRLYVIADPSDSSITLSRALFSHMRRNAGEGEGAKVLAFAVPESGTFGFMVNPKLERDTVTCQIQYNAEYRCVGFEALCPTVAMILYNYGFGADAAAKLGVSVRRTSTGDMFYQIDRPIEECAGTQPQG